MFLGPASMPPGLRRSPADPHFPGSQEAGATPNSLFNSLCGSGHFLLHRPSRSAREESLGPSQKGRVPERSLSGSHFSHLWNEDGHAGFIGLNWGRAQSLCGSCPLWPGGGPMDRAGMCSVVSRFQGALGLCPFLVSTKGSKLRGEPLAVMRITLPTSG